MLERPLEAIAELEPGRCEECRPRRGSNLQTFCTNPPARFVPEQDLESVLPGVGEDEEVPRQRIEPEIIADNACEGIERLPQGSGSNREIHPGVGQETQHRGNWAKSSPTQPHLAPGGTRSFQPLGATTSGQSGLAVLGTGRSDRNWTATKGEAGDV